MRVGVVRASRQINGSRGVAGRTLCGAPITDRDILLRDALRMTALEAERWQVCRDCRVILERARIWRPVADRSGPTGDVL